MIRDIAERGLASLVARWMLQGGADAVFDRIQRSAALKPEDFERLKAETMAHLHKVQADGAPYADTAMTILRDVAGAVPDLSQVVRLAGSSLAAVAAKSAEAAAERAHAWSTKLGDPPPDVGEGDPP